MPSLTVVVSSDTDIYISPGLYGDCLPTSATGGTADSFRAQRISLRVSLHARTSCSHTGSGAGAGPASGRWSAGGRPAGRGG
ncbi:hypothetical protein FNH04_44895, partial [Streptomyces phyllanthi]|nr:hypothetical protein [Streptomyces phyllanthi]